MNSADNLKKARKLAPWPGRPLLSVESKSRLACGCFLGISEPVPPLQVHPLTKGKSSARPPGGAVGPQSMATGLLESFLSSMSGATVHLLCGLGNLNFLTCKMGSDWLSENMNF